MATYLKHGHIRTGRAISFALRLGNKKAWDDLVIVLMVRLSKEERAALAHSALISLDEDTAYRAASVALFGVLNWEVVQ